MRGVKALFFYILFLYYNMCRATWLIYKHKNIITIAQYKRKQVFSYKKSVKKERKISCQNLTFWFFPMLHNVAGFSANFYSNIYINIAYFLTAHRICCWKMSSTFFEDASEAEEWTKNDQIFFLKYIVYFF